MEALSVIVAEDEENLRKLISAWLVNLGHRVLFEAADGAQAAQAALSMKPDLIIMDIKMPVMDGVEAVCLLDEMGCRTAVIFLSGLADSEIEERACQTRAMAFLRKPFNKEQLRPAIALAVSNHRRLQEADQEIKSLSDKLDTRKKIERAKGILMKRHQLNEEDAFKRIHFTARSTNKTMGAISEAIITASEII